jgi:hypothetical protein
MKASWLSQYGIQAFPPKKFQNGTGAMPKEVGALNLPVAVARNQVPAAAAPRAARVPEQAQELGFQVVALPNSLVELSGLVWPSKHLLEPVIQRLLPAPQPHPGASIPLARPRHPVLLYPIYPKQNQAFRNTSAGPVAVAGSANPGRSEDFADLFWHPAKPLVRPRFL